MQLLAAFRASNTIWTRILWLDKLPLPVVVFQRLKSHNSRFRLPHAPARTHTSQLEVLVQGFVVLPTIADALPAGVAELVAGDELGHDETTVAIADNGDRDSRHGGRVADSIQSATSLSEWGDPVGVGFTPASGDASFGDLDNAFRDESKERLIHCLPADFEGLAHVLHL